MLLTEVISLKSFVACLQDELNDADACEALSQIVRDNRLHLRMAVRREHPHSAQHHRRSDNRLHLRMAVRL